jgi:hypothetical protein
MLTQVTSNRTLTSVPSAFYLWRKTANTTAQFKYQPSEGVSLYTVAHFQLLEKARQQPEG